MLTEDTKATPDKEKKSRKKHQSRSQPKRQEEQNELAMQNKEKVTHPRFLLNSSSATHLCLSDVAINMIEDEKDGLTAVFLEPLKERRRRHHHHIVA